MIRSFTKNDIELQCIMQGDEMYFKGKDIARALDYKKPRKAITDHVSEENRKRLRDLKGAILRGTPNAQPHSLYINEEGLYELIFGSEKEEAKIFRKWVLGDVLPSLRKTGRYAMDGPNKLVFKIENEFDLHKKVVDYIRKYYPNLIVVAGLGELQDTSGKRIKSWQKGYQKGQPDLMILNNHKKYNGFCIELKTPKNNGVLSDAQKNILEAYEGNGFKVMVCNDYDEVCRSIYEYCQDIRIPCGRCIKKFKSAETLGTHLKIFHRYNE